MEKENIVPNSEGVDDVRGGDIIDDMNEDELNEVADIIEEDTKELKKDKIPLYEKICEENTESITVSLGMTIPSNIQYENYKTMASITIKKIKDPCISLDQIYKFGWKKVQEEIFKKYDEIMKSNKE